MVASDRAALAWTISSWRTCVAASAWPAARRISKILVSPMIAASGLRSSWPSFDSTSAPKASAGAAGGPGPAPASAAAMACDVTTGSTAGDCSHTLLWCAIIRSPDVARLLY